MRYTPSRAVLFLIALLFALNSLAEDAATRTFRPALIGKHETSMIHLIKFPKVKKDIQTAVKCESEIGEGGKLLATACFNGDRKFQQVILKASETATAKPALINDEPKSVYLLYTVIFRKSGDSEQVMVIPNHSANMKAHGLAYVSPQRLVHKRYAYNLNCPSRPFYHLVSAQIDAAGKISDIQLSKKDKKCPSCRRCVEKIAAMSDYIPGFVKSGPADMRYEEVFFQRSGSVSWYRGLSFEHPPSNVYIDTVH
jgi:hypothetical protein